MFAGRRPTPTRPSCGNWPSGWKSSSSCAAKTWPPARRKKRSMSKKRGGRRGWSSSLRSLRAARPTRGRWRPRRAARRRQGSGGGGGTKGLAGIYPVVETPPTDKGKQRTAGDKPLPYPRLKLIRPLLGMRRGELRDYLAERGHGGRGDA